MIEARPPRHLIFKIISVILKLGFLLLKVSQKGSNGLVYKSISFASSVIISGSCAAIHFRFTQPQTTDY